MCIKEITILEYLSKCKDYRTALSDYYVRNTVNGSEVRILAAFDKENLIGYCILNIVNLNLINLEYLFIKEDMCGTEAGNDLINAAMDYARQREIKLVLMRIVINNNGNQVENSIENLNIIEEVLVSNGFRVAYTSTVLRCKKDEKSLSNWNHFMNSRGKKLVEWNLKKGYRIVSFAEAGVMLDKLMENLESDFPRELNPRGILNNKNDKLVEDLSFIIVKDNKPVAYSMVSTTDGKTLVFQQLSVAIRYQHKGVFFLPVAAFAEGFISNDNYNKISFTIYDYNKKMKSLSNGFISNFTESKRKQKFYQCIINE